MLNTTSTVVFVPLHKNVYLGSMLFSETLWHTDSDHTGDILYQLIYERKLD